MGTACGRPPFHPCPRQPRLSPRSGAPPRRPTPSPARRLAGQGLCQVRREARRLRTVDPAMVGRQRQRQQQPRLEGRAVPLRLVIGLRQTEDRDFGRVDDRREERAADAAQRIENAVDKAYASGLKPMEYGGQDGTAAIAKAVMTALG